MTTDHEEDSPHESADPVSHSFSLPEPAVVSNSGIRSVVSSPDFAASGPSLPPNDIHVAWGWTDVGLLAVVAFGFTFLFLMVILLALAPFGLKLSQLQSAPNEWGVIVVSSQILTDLALLGYLAAQLRLRFRAPFWSTIGWRPLETPIGPLPTVALLVCVGVFLGALVIVASNIAPPRETLPIEKLLASPAAATLFMLTGILVAPVVEETIFRGYLYPVAARSLGLPLGIAVTGTLFGLLHSLQLWGGWWQIALLVVVGIVFTTARAITKSVFASWVLHVSYNSVQVVAMGISMGWSHHLTHLR